MSASGFFLLALDIKFSIKGKALNFMLTWQHCFKGILIILLCFDVLTSLTSFKYSSGTFITPGIENIVNLYFD